ncbi:peptide/nickel transport system substrate-binding protein [Pseudonocardia thermophila]|uniref:Peptide/nickel transport system substrate-binding protein n=1 Tax=Pseudonocardia thermophila TaxID=1848 RepID=A0A1M6XYQ1_PSETH|nr:ABC transporter substrate-binding protein [Pseudonocardia thermophila]SHL11134.1 peptide/nickel transport system substrate-binding protein [Pseudonocardia thermophila]
MAHLWRRSGAVTVLALLLAVTGCSSGAADEPVVFRVGFGGDPVTLDPRVSPPAYNIFLSPLYDTLIKSTADGGYAPGLATAWELSPDALRLSLTLREGVTFQDGTPFDAEAVRANLEAAKEPGTLVARTLTELDRVEVVDPTHVVLHMRSPGGHMLGVLAGETGMMISPGHLDSPDLATNPVGAGPFRLTELTGGRTTYAKWDGYWNAAAIELDGIEIHGFPDDTARLAALRSGQLDSSFLFPTQIEQAESAGLKTTIFPRTAVHAVLLNTSRSEFAKPQVRQALNLALDRAQLSETLYGGHCAVADQPYPDGYWAASPDGGAAAYDRDRARALLAEAGLPDGFEFTLSASNITTFQRLAEAVQGQLAEIGVRVKLDIRDNPSLTALRQSGNFDAVGGQYESGRPDPTTFLTDFYLPGGVFNPGRFNPPGGQELVAQARRTADVAVRKEPIQRLVAEVAASGPPIIPVCFPGYVEADAPHVTHPVSVSVLGDYDFSAVRMTSPGSGG